MSESFDFCYRHSISLPILQKDIINLLPHRESMLLVDSVVDIDCDRIIATKKIQKDEFFLQGHFPNYPIMPGVLMVEAIAQTGGILCNYLFVQVGSSRVPSLGDDLGVESDNVVSNFKVRLTGIESAKFKKEVLPEDTMYIMVNDVKSKRLGGATFVSFSGEVRVNDQLCASARVSCAVVD